VSRADHVLRGVFKWFYLLVYDGFDIWIKLVLGVNSFTSVIAKRALKICTPFVVFTRSFVPSISCH